MPIFRKLAALVLLVGWLSSTGCPNPSAPSAVALSAESILVFFSPNGGATEAIVEEIDHARQKIMVQAYSFTSQPVARALIEAKQRGIAVEVVLDKSQKSEKYSAADFAANAGIPTYIDSVHAIAHNKIMILDDRTIVTGSFNFTKAAEERNAENLLIIRDDPKLVGKYLSNYHLHKSHSTPYSSRAAY